MDYDLPDLGKTVTYPDEIPTDEAESLIKAEYFDDGPDSFAGFATLASAAKELVAAVPNDQNARSRLLSGELPTYKPGSPYYPPNWDTQLEKEFKPWYETWAKEANINPDPDAPEHLYDYRSAFLHGDTPTRTDDGSMHWPSQYKFIKEIQGVNHPTRYIDDPLTPGHARDTVTGMTKRTAGERWENAMATVGQTVAGFTQFLGALAGQGKNYSETQAELTTKDDPHALLRLQQSLLTSLGQDPAALEKGYQALAKDYGKIRTALDDFATGFEKPIPGQDPLIQELVEQQLPFAIPMVVSAINPVAGYLATLFSVTGISYQDSKEKGATDEEALINAGIQGVVQGNLEFAGTLVEFSALKKLFSVAAKSATKAVREKTGGYLQSVFQMMLGEGLEEGLQQFPQTISDIYFEHKDRLSIPEMVQQVRQQWKRMLAEAGAASVMGAVGSLVTLGPIGAIGAGFQARRQRKFEEAQARVNEAVGKMEEERAVPPTETPSATFLGYQKRLSGPPMPLFNIVGGEFANSTVSEQGLRDKGIDIPQFPAPTDEDLKPLLPARSVPINNTALYTDYQTAAEDVQGERSNIHIQRTPTNNNADRVLLVQINPHATGQKTEIADPYFEKLYQQRSGYAKPEDFWELPEWIGEATHFLGDKADVYVVRDPDEATDYIRDAGYRSVMFSAMDVNKDTIAKISKQIPGEVLVGGYVAPDTFATVPNVRYLPSLEAAAQHLGVEYRKGVDYSHFTGTRTVPRLCLSKGCTHKCAFCTIPKTVESFSKEDIDQQLAAFEPLDFELIYLNDKTFGQAPNHTQLPDIYAQIRKSHPNFQGFIIQTTAPQLLKMSDEFLQSAHIKFVELGVESYNNSILAKIHKPHNEKLLDEAAAKLRVNNIALIPNILVSLAGRDKSGKIWSETPATYKRTMDFLERNSDIISHTNVYNLALYQGTELSDQLAEKAVAGDIDENQVARSWQTDPAMHEKFYRDVLDFSSRMLDKTPGVDMEAELPFTTHAEAEKYGRAAGKEEKQRLKMRRERLTEEAKFMQEAGVRGRPLAELARRISTVRTAEVAGEEKVPTKEEAALAFGKLPAIETEKFATSLPEVLTRMRQDLVVSDSFNYSSLFLTPDGRTIQLEGLRGMHHEVISHYLPPGAVEDHNITFRFLAETGTLRVAAARPHLLMLDMQRGSQVSKDQFTTLKRFVEKQAESEGGVALTIEVMDLDKPFTSREETFFPYNVSKLRAFINGVNQVARGGQADGVYKEVERKEAEKQVDFAFGKDQEIVPTFYSQLLRVLETKLPNAGTGEQFRELVNGWAKKGEFKADELKWSGLDDYIAAKEGKVSKQEVLDYLKANQVEIKEVTKGVYPNRYEAFVTKMEAKYGEGYSSESLTTAEREEQGHLWTLTQQRGGMREGEPKFYQWQLPGGENYKEVTLNLAGPDLGFRVPPAHQYGDAADINRLAHVRMNDRVDVEGKRVLLLEEVQSDWHQKGRKQGYRTGLKQQNFATWLAAHGQKLTVELEKQFRTRQGIDVELWELEQERARAEMLSVPAAPFARTWHELVLKRMLRYAAENGYDKLAWTTGEQQAERYDLSKHLSSVELVREGDNYRIYGTRVGSSKEEILASRVKEENLADHIGKELAEKASRDLHATGLKVERKTYSGLDLRVGGEGMRGFYDKIIPEFLNKYGKKWGAKVGETKVPTDKYKGYESYESGISIIGNPAVFGVSKDGTRTLVQQFGRFDSDKAGIEVARLNSQKTEGVSVHSLPITSSMSTSVLTQGQPLFTFAQTVDRVITSTAPDYQRATQSVYNALIEAGARVEDLGDLRVRLVEFINLPDPATSPSYREWLERMSKLSNSEARKWRPAAKTIIEFPQSTIEVARMLFENRLDRDLNTVMYHEWYHVVKRLFMPEETRALIDSLYPGEENQADAFRDFVIDQRSHPEAPNAQRGVWLRILDFLRRVYNHIRRVQDRQGLVFAEDVFRDIFQGNYRDRQTVVDSAAYEFEPAPLSLWHGTRARFSRFVDDFMGQGEGNSTFGWGHYLSGSDEIGRYYASQEPQNYNQSTVIYTIGGKQVVLRDIDSSDLTNMLDNLVTIRSETGRKVDEKPYRDALLNEVGIRRELITEDLARIDRTLSRTLPSVDLTRLTQIRDSLLDENKRAFVDSKISAFQSLLDQHTDALNLKPELQTELAALKTIEENLDKEIKFVNGRYLYHVELADKNPNWLLWHEPLSREDATIIARQAKKEKRLTTTMVATFRNWKNLEGVDAYFALIQLFEGDKQSASEFLSRAGFTGIKYQAGTVTGKEMPGIYNYVVFDPENLKITEMEQFAFGKEEERVAEDTKSTFFSFEREPDPTDTGDLSPQFLKLPQLVWLAKQLSGGKYPRILENFAKMRLKNPAQTLGFFSYGKTKITLRADIFKDPHLAASVLSHELGHLADWLPDELKNLKQRGNILGHIAALKKMTEELLPNRPGAEGKLSSADLQRLRAEVEALLAAKSATSYVDEEITHTVPIKPEDILLIWNSVEQARLINPDLYRFIAMLDTNRKKLIIKDALKGLVHADLSRFAKTIREKTGKKIPVASDFTAEDLGREITKRINEELKKRRVFYAEEITNELISLTQMWKPFDASNDQTYTRYRYSPTELYADAFSVLMTAPRLAKTFAPKFYEAWFNYLEARPTVQAAYNGIQSMLRSGEFESALTEETFNMFDRGDAAYTDRLTRAEPSTADKLKEELIDVFHYILRDVRRIESTMSPGENPRYSIENMTYSMAEAEAYVTDLMREVVKPLEKAGLKWDREFGLLAFLRRVALERAQMANPLGWDAEAALEKMKKMEKTELTAEQWSTLNSALTAFHDIHNRYFVTKALQSGMFTDAQIQMFLDRENYVTFAVQHYLTEHHGPAFARRIYQQIGTFQEIANPATATVLQDISFIRTMNRNRAIKDTVNFYLKHGETFGITLEKAKRGPRGFILESSDPSKGLVVYMEEGKSHGSYLPKEIADAFDANPFAASGIGKILSFMVAPFRNLYTNLNYGFWEFNLIRDYFRVAGNLPQANIVNFAKYWLKGIAPAFRSSFNIPDPNVAKMLKGDMLISMADLQGMRTSDNQMERLQKMFSEDAREWEGKFWKPVGHLFNYIAALPRVMLKTGKALERTTKVGAYLYVKDTFPTLPNDAIAHIVRNAGSPDFLRKGSWYAVYNNLLLFSNAMKEGYRGDFEAMQSNPLAFWFKKAQYIMIPKLIQFMIYAGLLSWLVPWGKEILHGVSDYLLTNYIVIPLGVTKSGKSVVFTLPSDETSRFLGAVQWKAMRSPDLGISDTFTATTDYMAGQVPTVSPIFSIPSYIMNYVSGHNPYDSHFGRFAVDDLTFKAGGWRSHAQFLKFLANQSGAGIVHRFQSDNEPEVREEFESLLGFPVSSPVADWTIQQLGKPVISNSLGRFIRVTDVGHKQEIRKEVLELAGRPNANAILDAREVAQKIINDKPLTDEDYARMQLKPQAFSNAMLSQLAKKIGNVYIEEFVSAASNDDKAVILRRALRKLREKEQLYPSGDPLFRDLERGIQAMEEIP